MRLKKLIRETDKYAVPIEEVIMRMKRRIQTCISRVMIQYQTPMQMNNGDITEFQKQDDQTQDLRALWNYARDENNETIIMWLATDPEKNPLTMAILRFHPRFNDLNEYTTTEKAFGCNILTR